MAELQASLIFNVIDRLTAPMRKITATVNRLDRTQRRLERSTRSSNQLLQQRSRYLDAVAKATGRLEMAEAKMQKRMMAGGGAVLVGNQILNAGRRMLRPFTGSLGQAGMFEDYELSFGVLLGGAMEGRKRLEHLANFGAKTNFELPGIVQASMTLETLTMGALSTGDGLRMVGDVAAGVNKPITELSMWFGRLYDGILTGRPVGEALMRMQELGAMSGDTRNKIEEMQKSGVAGSKIWEMVAASFGRFSGMMEVRNKSLTGKMSNLSDIWVNFRAAVGKPLIPIVKPFITGLTKMLEWLTKLTERMPWVSALIAIMIGGLGLLTLGIGSVITIGGGLLGFLGMAAYGLEWFSIKTNLATLRLKAFNFQQLLTSKGLLILGRGIGIRFAAATSWIWALAGGAIPGLLASLKVVGVAIAGISAPVWGIVAAVAAAVAAIWFFWEPIKNFFQGWWAGFTTAAAPIREAFQPLLDAGRWILSLFGALLPERMKGFSNLAFQLGGLMGSIFGSVVKILFLPLRMFTLLIEAVSSLKDVFTGLLSPLEAASKLWGKLKGFFGFGGEGRSPAAAAHRVTRPARRVTRTVAAASLATSPAFASGAVAPTQEPTPIVRQIAPGDNITLNAPITVNVPPGADAAAMGQEVERAVKTALAQAQREQAASRRRNLYGS